MNALRRIHAALVPGGLVVDTQPVSPHPPVEAQSGVLGALDMREWAQTIDVIDGLVASAVGDGLFALVDEAALVVADAFDDGAEALDLVRKWQGTRIGIALAKRLREENGPVRVHQDVRLRLLRAR